MSEGKGGERWYRATDERTVYRCHVRSPSGLLFRIDVWAVDQDETAWVFGLNGGNAERRCVSRRTAADAMKVGASYLAGELRAAARECKLISPPTPSTSSDEDGR